MSPPPFPPRQALQADTLTPPKRRRVAGCNTEDHPCSVRNLLRLLPILALTSLAGQKHPKRSQLSETPAPTKLKIYISVDMEGVAGVVASDQLGPPAWITNASAGFMTNEALAAVQAAKDSGATESSSATPTATARIS